MLFSDAATYPSGDSLPTAYDPNNSELIYGTAIDNYRRVSTKLEGHTNELKRLLEERHYKNKLLRLQQRELLKDRDIII